MRLFMCGESKNLYTDSFKRLFSFCGKGKKTDKAQIFYASFFTVASVCGVLDDTVL